MGVQESGQHRIRVWEQRGHLASLQHPVSPSYHSKSTLSFQPSLPELSSHHALLLLTLFLPVWLGRRIECHVPGCLWCFAIWRWRMEVGRKENLTVSTQNMAAGPGHHKIVDLYGKGNLLLQLCLLWHHVLKERQQLVGSPGDAHSWLVSWYSGRKA